MQRHIEDYAATMAPIKEILYRTPKLLLVEDDLAMCDALGMVLSDAGYDVQCQTDGISAARAITRDGHDALLTDLRLPGASGIDLLNQARHIDAHFPVVVMSAYSDPEALKVVRRMHADFFPKPLNLDQLIVRLNAQLIAAQTRLAHTLECVLCGTNDLVIEDPNAPGTGYCMECVRTGGPCESENLSEG